MSSAIWLMVSGLIPPLSPPARASPLNFSKMRVNFGLPAKWTPLLFGHGRHFGGKIVLFLLNSFAKFITDKAADHHVLTDFGDQIGQKVADSFVGVFYEFLIEKADFSRPLFDLAV